MHSEGPISRFDDALPRFVNVVVRHLGETALGQHAFLRDTDGVLTLILRGNVDEEVRVQLQTDVVKALGKYAASQPVATAPDLFDPRLEQAQHDQLEAVRYDGGYRFVRLVERRIVGQDWLRGIQPVIPNCPPVVVFASHKGGVGRSTALAIAAADFAARGKSILAIDLDLEAPGLGGMFLSEADLPLFGALDYYVESGRSIIDRPFLRSMMSESPLPNAPGRVMVVPAVGQKCREYPQNVIGKLARAYLDGVESVNGSEVSFLDGTRHLIEELCGLEDYDAVFLDARSGLNETTATTIQGLGADVLFFGVDTPQTWDGYRYFLAHLARFKPRTGENDWRYRLRMVHAKAPADPRNWSQFRDHSFELFAEHLYDELDETAADVESQFGFDVDDREAPHYAWPILIDSTYYAFDPIARREQLEEPVYGRTFGAFTENLAQRLGFS